MGPLRTLLTRLKDNPLACVFGLSAAALLVGAVVFTLQITSAASRAMLQRDVDQVKNTARQRAQAVHDSLRQLVGSAETCARKIAPAELPDTPQSAWKNLQSESFGRDYIGPYLLDSQSGTILASPFDEQRNRLQGQALGAALKLFSRKIYVELLGEKQDFNGREIDFAERLEYSLKEHPQKTEVLISEVGRIELNDGKTLAANQKSPVVFVATPFRADDRQYAILLGRDLTSFLEELEDSHCLAFVSGSAGQLIYHSLTPPDKNFDMAYMDKTFRESESVYDPVQRKKVELNPLGFGPWTIYDRKRTASIDKVREIENDGVLIEKEYNLVEPLYLCDSAGKLNGAGWGEAQKLLSDVPVLFRQNRGRFELVGVPDELNAARKKLLDHQAAFQWSADRFFSQRFRLYVLATPFRVNPNDVPVEGNSAYRPTGYENVCSFAIMQAIPIDPIKLEPINLAISSNIDSINLVGLAFAGVLAIFYWILGWMIITPIQQLRDAAREYARVMSTGSSAVDSALAKLPRGRLCEIQQVADAFKKLIEKVQQQQQSLKDDIDEATRDLRRKTEELQQRTVQLEQNQYELQQKKSELEQTNAELGKKQAELSQNNIELEKKTAELERKRDELQHNRDELEQKRKELEENKHLRELFLDQVNHDIRNPLSAIAGYAMLLKVGKLDDKQRERIQGIQAAAKRIELLVEEIKEYQSIIQGTKTPEPKTFDLRSLLDELRMDVDNRVRANGVELIIDVADDVPEMFSDRGAMSRIIGNLLSNACKACKSSVGKQVRCTVALERGAPDDIIVIEIQDQGRGLSPEEQEKLFRPYEKIVDRAENPDGTGLGLVNCRGLCKTLHGTVAVDPQRTALGRGATFVVRVPARYHGEQPAHPLASRTEVLANGRNLALVVDDDLDICSLLKEYLIEHDFEVIEAHDGPEGLALASERQPGVITLDAQLPMMDGWRVLKELKGNPNTSHIPVIMVTIFNNPRRGFALGADDYVNKPIDWKYFGEILERYRSRSARILVIDDDPAIRAVISETLEPQNWDVTEAADGAKGLECVRQSRPDVILLDLIMPGINGFEFLERLRSEPDWREIPVIILTGKHLTQDELTQFDGLVTQVMTKSTIAWESLRESIKRLLAQSVGSHLQTSTTPQREPTDAEVAGRR